MNNFKEVIETISDMRKNNSFNEDLGGNMKCNKT